MGYSLLFSFLFFSFVLSSGSPPAVFLFGDSLLDAGNNRFVQNCLIQANFPPYGEEFFHQPTGRFTNGRTVGDFIAEAMGLELQKPYMEVDMLVRSGKMKDYPTNGINFASAGSGVLKETNKLMGVIPLQDQLQQFENLVNGGKLDEKIVEQALYLFETGSNDVFLYFVPTEQQRPSPDAFVEEMVSEFHRVIQRVYELGARRIAVFGLAPVGCIPARINIPGTSTEQCYPRMNEMAFGYNLGLEALVKGMPTKMQGAVGVYARAFEVVSGFLSFPVRYRFTNVSSACCGSGALRGMGQCGSGQFELCKDPDNYVFWDNFHPTQHAYNLIFKAFWNGRSSRIRPMNLKTLVNVTIPLPP